MLTAAPRVEVRVIESMFGKMKIGSGAEAFARVWLLEDQTLVAATTLDRKSVSRNTYKVVAARINSDLAAFDLEGGETATVQIRPCGCGMGAVASARVIDERHKIVRVVRPEWVEVG